MESAEPAQACISTLATSNALVRASSYPQLRFMGSKHRLLPWLHGVLSEYRFDTALDPFCGSGAVSYLLKCMGKQVTSSDFLDFCATIARATVENSSTTLSPRVVEELRQRRTDCPSFIRDTYGGVFFSRRDLGFLDTVWCNLRRQSSFLVRSIAIAAMVRACVKRQPRGVFTVAGNGHYDDGRRDLHMTLERHFLEQVKLYNSAVFDNGKRNRALQRDVFELRSQEIAVDLVYLDPPYVPRSDDNCYVKRYHFLEGLSHYWEGEEIMLDTKVKKIRKKYTPFSYRKDAVPAFERLFEMFRRSIIALSYSSNGYPDIDNLVALMRKVKRRVAVEEQPHRYHFGTHNGVKRALVTEYLIVGTD